MSKFEESREGLHREGARIALEVMLRLAQIPSLPAVSAPTVAIERVTDYSRKETSYRVRLQGVAAPVRNVVTEALCNSGIEARHFLSVGSSPRPGGECEFYLNEHGLARLQGLLEAPGPDAKEPCGADMQYLVQQLRRAVFQRNDALNHASRHNGLAVEGYIMLKDVGQEGREPMRQMLSALGLKSSDVEFVGGDGRHNDLVFQVVDEQLAVPLARTLQQFGFRVQPGNGEPLNQVRLKGDVLRQVMRLFATSEGHLAFMGPVMQDMRATLAAFREAPETEVPATRVNGETVVEWERLRANARGKGAGDFPDPGHPVR
jgi:hypothetical protein